MINEVLKLIILFFVIFDPPVSLGVYVKATQGMKQHDARRIAILAMGLAAGLSLLFLAFGLAVLDVFSTSIEDFRVAGGIVLAVLGLNMVLGRSASDIEKTSRSTAAGIAAIIATPLLTGPAAITAIVVSVHDFGQFITGIAVLAVLAATALLFYHAHRIFRFLGSTTIQVISTLLGLVTLSWGVDFIRRGLGF